MPAVCPLDDMTIHQKPEMTMGARRRAWRRIGALCGHRRTLRVVHVRTRAKTVVRILVVCVAGLAVVSILLFLWFGRRPTTQLIDASGQALTAGGAIEGGEVALGGSLFEAVQTLINQKEFAAAREKLLRIVEESDRDGEACVLLCDVSRELKEVEAAVDYGLKAVELLPDSAEAHLSYARALGAQIFADMQSFGGMLSAMTRLGHFKAQMKIKGS